MYKIAILGCENSHAINFLEFIKNDAEFSDVEVIGVYSNEAAPANALNEKYGVPVMENADDLVGQVDGVMVTARDGKHHLPYVKPYLEAGIPVFMDKPITVKIDEAEEMMELFRKYGNKFTGGSTVKHCAVVKEIKSLVGAPKDSDERTIGGVVRAPINPKNDYGDFYFYAQHLVEIVSEVFGSFPKSIVAREKNEDINVLFRYDEYDIQGFYGSHSDHYYISLFTFKGTRSEPIEFQQEIFREEFDHFYRLLKGETPEQDAKRFIAPVYLMNAIEKALESGEEVVIDWN